MAKPNRPRKRVYQSANEVFTHFIPGYVYEKDTDDCFDGAVGLSEESGVILGKMIAKEFTEGARASAQQRVAAGRHLGTRGTGGSSARAS